MVFIAPAPAERNVYRYALNILLQLQRSGIYTRADAAPLELGSKNESHIYKHSAPLELGSKNESLIYKHSAPLELES
jgi:hypothetical protein